MAKVYIQQLAFGAKRWRSIEMIDEAQAQVRVAELQREYPMCDHRIAEIKPRKRRQRVREWF